MGKARQIRLDTKVFEKAGDADQFFSAMLNRYPIDGVVLGSDKDDLRALLKRHDEADEKIGVGIDHFEVAAAPEPHGGRCFWVVRTDGSRADFSFKKCLERKPYD